MNAKDLPGIYDLDSIEASIDGRRTDEVSRPGMFTFTRDGRLSVVSASTHMVMAYTGTYRIEGDTLFIAVESCINRALEGTTITRKIVRLDGVSLVLEVFSPKTNQRTLLTWKKKIPL